MKTVKQIVTLVMVLMLVGCASTSTNEQATNEQSKRYELTEIEQVTPYEGEGASFVNSIYTTAEKMALTFDGLPESSKLDEILAKLDEINATATFFVTGIRAAEEPELIAMIEEAGHEVQSLTLNKDDLRNRTYQIVYNSFLKSKQVIENGEREVKYIRTVPAVEQPTFSKVAKHTSYEALIGYSLFLKDEDLEDTFKTPEELRLYIKRGGIVNINIDQNENIVSLLSLLKQGVDEVNYELVSLSSLMKEELEHRAYDEIEKTTVIDYNQNAEDAQYTIIEHGSRNIKQVALTLDDWGTDYTVVNIVNILKKYDVPATFFLRGNGVEKNPSLVRAIFDEGFEIANHSYSHPVVTTISDDEIQAEVIKTHKLLTEAIQHEPLLMFRPPTGKIDHRSASAVAATGYKVIGNYDLTTTDWDIANDAEAIVKSVTDSIQNGSIILIHILDGLHTMEALPTLIEEVRAMGYEFVPMSKMVYE